MSDVPPVTARGASTDAMPRPRWWLLRVLNWQTVAGLGALISLLTVFAGWVGSNATKDATTVQAARHAAEFEVSVDKRLVEILARMDATDRDREARGEANRTRIDELAKVLHGRIDDTNAALRQRGEARTAEVNALAQRVNGLEIKLCVVSGVKVSACR